MRFTYIIDTYVNIACASVIHVRYITMFVKRENLKSYRTLASFTKK